MKTYEVTIEAVVRKTYKIEAKDDQKAQELAQELAQEHCVLNDPVVGEYYTQNILEVCES